MHVRVELDVHHARTELVGAHLWSLGAIGVLEQPGTLVAWFPRVPAALTAAAGPGSALPPELAPALLRWTEEPERDWQAAWKATIAPVRAGRTVVVPTWLADEHRPAPGERTLVLDPGQAFGSGHHATTALCLELLEDLPLDGATVADVGCGTGVLAIAAAAAGAEVVAVDVDPLAITVTAENAARNDVRLRALVGSVDALPGPADVVVANLVTDTIVALAADLVAATGTTLVVSGIAVERRARALDALVAAGAEVVEVRDRDGWVAARLRPSAGERDR